MYIQLRYSLRFLCGIISREDSDVAHGISYEYSCHRRCVIEAVTDSEGRAGTEEAGARVLLLYMASICALSGGDTV